MATGTVIMPILAAIPDPTNPPSLAFDADTNRPYLEFDWDTDELVIWTFMMPADYSSDPVVKLIWSGAASTTVTHTATWGAQIMAVTPDTDSVDMGTDSYDTAITADDDILGTTARRPQAVTLTMTNNDGVAAGDYVALRVYRDANAANDDLNEDAWLWGAVLEYTTS